jgi:hypothetical protein
MLFKVLKHAKNNDPQRPVEPVVYVVEEAELLHFLHEIKLIIFQHIGRLIQIRLVRTTTRHYN